MQQFAVFTTPFRVVTPSEAKTDPQRGVPVNLGPHREPKTCVLEKPKAYLVSALDADSAMYLVERFAANKGIELIVHRAVEVGGTIPHPERRKKA